MQFYLVAALDKNNYVFFDLNLGFPIFFPFRFFMSELIKLLYAVSAFRAAEQKSLSGSFFEVWKLSFSSFSDEKHTVFHSFLRFCFGFNNRVVQ
jgi:hypothetical protein